ncbi:Pkinase-domain-containing protein [Marasmius fiardii PR-910]|nr:Pkinase-domain-containing protein [Marasmius fiardii PR-910]
MVTNTSLQIPQTSSTKSPNRPVSVNVHSPSASSQSPPSSSRKQRASHQVVSPQQQSREQNLSRTQEDANPPYTDVYNHPAAIAYAAAHPRRTIPKFGPYLLLQTLGEGEFGKVKLGLHCQWGEEVAVKLIRRGNVDTAVRMSKVEREIEVLRTLKHPNIVRLYDVIETDKYIGIVIEYASGGELFDHILAHRYLKERDAAKLFSQLISGVWYIHQKKIVHRDLKLENLLLDRHRNVIITDFGFANRFEHRADDLMQTSCGSPCYAAPELVISEGLYVGSAVDIWSCGVILYAMLAGYLPFDDDPANPDGDNINLLYKYIVNTPLSFPDYISESARDLLSIMLVPDPGRRASLDLVMKHPWLAMYNLPPTEEALRSGKPTAFGKTVEDLEGMAMEQHHQKRLAYQRQIKQAAAQLAAAREINPNNTLPNMGRSQSHKPDPANTSLPAAAARSQSQTVEPTTALYVTNGREKEREHERERERDRYISDDINADDPFAAPGAHPSEKKRQDARHTVQVEYDPRPPRRPQEDQEQRRRHTRDREREEQPSPAPSPAKQDRRTRESQPTVSSKPLPITPSVASSPSTQRRDKEREQEQEREREREKAREVERQREKEREKEREREREREKEKERTRERERERTEAAPFVPSKHIPPPVSMSLSASQDTPSMSVTPASAPGTPRKFNSQDQKSVDSAGSGSTRTHRKGMSSVDKLIRIVTGGSGDDVTANTASAAPTNASGSLLSPDKEKDESSNAPSSTWKSSRRATLQVMVGSFRGVRSASSTRKGDADPLKTPVSAAPPTMPDEEKSERGRTMEIATDDSSTPGSSAASTKKAMKVMQWFRNKSKARDSVGIGGESRTPANEEGYGTTSKSRKNASSSIINQPGTIPDAYKTMPAMSHAPRTEALTAPPAQASSSIQTPNSIINRFRDSFTISNSTPGSRGHRSSTAKKQQAPANPLRVHHGAVDPETTTTKPPQEVMKHITEVLVGMGVDVQAESEYKLRCVRAKKRREASSPIATVGDRPYAAVTMVGSAASNGVDRRGLPVPSQSSATGSMLRMLMRRQSSQVSTDDGGMVANTPSDGMEPMYGEWSEDVGDEVKFSVELTRLDRLEGTYSVDIRRMKGNLRSYKFLYDTIKSRAALQ